MRQKRSMPPGELVVGMGFHSPTDAVAEGQEEEGSAAGGLWRHVAVRGGGEGEKSREEGCCSYSVASLENVRGREKEILRVQEAVTMCYSEE
jgi:hypothetical protein